MLTLVTTTATVIVGITDWRDVANDTRTNTGAGLVATGVRTSRDSSAQRPVLEDRGVGAPTAGEGEQAEPAATANATDTDDGGTAVPVEAPTEERVADVPDPRPATAVPTREPPVPTRTPAPVAVAPGGAGGGFTATRYGETYNGQVMGCNGAGVYSSADTSILAAGPDYYALWPCGTQLRVCGAAGCIYTRRTDSCPGCSGAWIDLSEAGLWAVCASRGRCTVSVEVLK